VLKQIKTCLLKNLLNQGIIIRFLFLLMLLFGYDSYSQRNIGFEPSYIEIVIPDYAILTPEKDSQINDRFKEYLYSYNLSLITEDSNISKMMQNKYVYDRIRAESDAILKKSNEYDFIKLCLTSMFPELIFEKMDQYCGYYYENEFDYPYLIFFTNESSKISNEINVDFSLSFEKFHLGKKNDSLFTSIKIVDKEGNDYIINHQDKLSFERHQDLEDDLFRFFGNITPEVSSFICSRDKNLVENQNIKLKQRNYVINNFVFDSKIPESLSNKLKAEEPALKCYSYKDGLLNNEETIFKGYFYRIFNDSTGQHFLRNETPLLVME